MSVDLPSVTITEPALRAFRAAEEDDADSENVLRLTIDAHFQNDLFFGPREAGDVVVVASGITLAMDSGTARRADGLTIDYVEGSGGVGFKLKNPNQDPPVKGVRPADLTRMLEGGEDLLLVDARSADERAKARLDAARPLDERYEKELRAMPKGKQLVFMAHHTRGGLAAARRFFDEGFTNVWYVVGGIDAWSTIDSTIPRY